MTGTTQQLTDATPNGPMFDGDTPVHPSRSVFDRLRHPVPRVRPTWDQTWMQVAVAMAERAECTRSRVGAVVVAQNRSTWPGYNGAPAGEVHCTDGGCPRGRLSAEECPPRSEYGNCVALHAEMNALVLAGAGARGAELYSTREPCDWCRKIAKAAGVLRVHWLEEGDVIRTENL